MKTKNGSRYGLHIGLDRISYVKVESSGSAWELVDSGHIDLTNADSGLSQHGQLRTELPRLARDKSFSRELTHVSLHNRYCITRVVTGDKDQIEEQFQEIEQNSQHYLQLGLGDKLLGTSSIRLEDAHWYGQVAIIKRGLIETIENATKEASLELESVECALSSIARLAGCAGLDDTPLLIVWPGAGGTEIGISFSGRLQLNYHAGAANTAETTVRVVSKHLKRLRRFCDRYRQVGGSTELRRVLVLADADQTQTLKETLEQLDFDHVYTMSDFHASAIGDTLGGQQIDSPGALSALGGLLYHMEDKVIPMTDIYRRHLDSKPKSLFRMLVGNGWPIIAASVLFSSVLATNRWLDSQVQDLEIQLADQSDNAGDRQGQLFGLSESREFLSEISRLENALDQVSMQTIIGAIAKCMPDDARLETLAIDGEGRLQIKGTMLHGDRTYELLKALGGLPGVKDVALESVGSAVNFGQKATLFEIHCEIDRKVVDFDGQRVAAVYNGDRQP